MSDITSGFGGRGWRWSIGVCFLFSGAALLMHILQGISLLVGLIVAVLSAILAFVYVRRRIDPYAAAQVRSHVRVGVVAGVLAIVAYDVAKAGLAAVDPSAFDPFGAIPIFGALIVGQSAPAQWLTVAGVGYHVLNGVTFAVAYSIMFGRRGTLAGVGWGVFLESFQFTLYPGWLNTAAFYTEFVTISFLAHVAYGATLGYVCKRSLTSPMRHGGLRSEVEM